MTQQIKPNPMQTPAVPVPKKPTAEQTTGALANMARAQQQFIADVLTKKPTHIYRLDDYNAIRQSLFDNVKDAVQRRFPLYNDRFSLGVENVDYDDPDDYDVDVQKDALLEGRSITRRLRGEWVLRNADGKEVARTRRMTLMRVPFMTGRGTFIRNGREYAFTNIMRLEPGVYTKRKNDEISAQFNIKQGTGPGFSMLLNPNTGVFQIRRGTANAPAYVVFHDMGITDEQMEKAWGKELFQKNKEAGAGDKARQAASRIYNM